MRDKVLIDCFEDISLLTRLQSSLIKFSLNNKLFIDLKIINRKDVIIV